MLVFLVFRPSQPGARRYLEVVFDEGRVDLHLRLATTLMFLSHDLISQPFNIMPASARAISTMPSNSCHDEWLRPGWQATSLVIRSLVGPDAVK